MKKLKAYSSTLYDVHRKYILATLILLGVISLSIFIVYLGLPKAQFTVSGYPSAQNYASYTYFSATNNCISYAIINNTYQVSNVGEFAIDKLNVNFKVYPNDQTKTCDVISTSVYSGTPSPSNLIATTKDGYLIDKLNVDANLTFTFQTKSTNFDSDTTYILIVTSSNAGSFYREVISQGKYGSTIHEQYLPSGQLPSWYQYQNPLITLSWK